MKKDLVKELVNKYNSTIDKNKVHLFKGGYHFGDIVDDSIDSFLLIYNDIPMRRIFKDEMKENRYEFSDGYNGYLINENLEVMIKPYGENNHENLKVIGEDQHRLNEFIESLFYKYKVKSNKITFKSLEDFHLIEGGDTFKNIEINVVKNLGFQCILYTGLMETKYTYLSEILKVNYQEGSNVIEIEFFDNYKIKFNMENLFIELFYGKGFRYSNIFPLYSEDIEDYFKIINLNPKYSNKPLYDINSRLEVYKFFKRNGYNIIKTNNGVDDIINFNRIKESYYLI